VVLFEVSGSLVAALIENKIAATFQPEQSQRYATRAARWATSPKLLRVVTVLLAPQEYLSRSGAELFDVCLSYEDVVSLLRSNGDRRSTFLADAMDAGVEAYRQGYAPVPDVSATDVWSQCWDLSQRVTPRLNFQRPGAKPALSNWIEFRQADGFTLDDSKRVLLVYKAERGQADLQFSRTSPFDLSKAVGHLLDSSMNVVSAGKSASIRIAVPTVSFGASAQDQTVRIVEGLIACEKLRAFFVQSELRAALGTTDRRNPQG
jgi:hypothetical protein